MPAFESRTGRGMVKVRGASLTPLDRDYRFFVCDSALPAADLAALLKRPSRSTLEAVLATRADVCFLLGMASSFLFGSQGSRERAAGMAPLLFLPSSIAYIGTLARRNNAESKHY